MTAATATIVSSRQNFVRLTGDTSLTGGRCQCSFCGKKFKSVSAFERHQVRPKKGGSVGCLNAEGMRQKGMVLNDEGWWTTKEFKGISK